MTLKPSHLTGYGKALYKQRGGSWSDFTGWLKKAGNKIVDAGKTVWEKAVKPAYQFAKDSKILSTAASAVKPEAGMALKAVGLGRKKKAKGGLMKWSGIDDKYAGMVNFPKKPVLAGSGVRFG